MSLISHTTTRTGLKVYSELDEKKYPLAKKVSNNEMKAINLHPHETNGISKKGLLRMVSNDLFKVSTTIIKLSSRFLRRLRELRGF